MAESIPVQKVEEGAILTNDFPIHLYGGQLAPKRAWVMKDSQSVVFSMVDEHGRVFLANFDREMLKNVVKSGEVLFGNPG